MSVEDIFVSCAVIRQGSRYLVAQRSATMREPLRWEFPGGKIEVGENALACLHREIKEELGLFVNIQGFLKACVHLQNTRRIILWPFLCTIQSGQLELSEHSATCWLTSEELPKLSWCEADLDIVTALSSIELERTEWWLN